MYLKRGLYLQYFLQAGNKKVRRLNPPGYGSSREVVRHIYFKCLRGLNFQDLLGNRKVVVIKVVDKFVVVSLSKLSLNLLFSKMVFLQKKKATHTRYQIKQNEKLTKLPHAVSGGGSDRTCSSSERKKIDFYYHFQIEARFIHVIGSFVIS